ncbi:hypothetical protein EDD16DRAFT_1484953, partial [Pisolithus croceorrhizus]
LVQCYMDHTFLGKCYSSFVPLEDLSHPSGQPIQTHGHIITYCLRRSHCNRPTNDGEWNNSPHQISPQNRHIQKTR